MLNDMEEAKKFFESGKRVPMATNEHFILKDHLGY